MEINIGLVIKFDKRSKTTSKKKKKKLTMTSCHKIVTSLPFFQFKVNLPQSGSRIPDE